jgi:CrcB protein
VSTPPGRVGGRALAAVFAGGMAGAMLRALLDDAMSHGATQWPWATFACNVAGALLLGCVAAGLLGRAPYRRPLLGAGFCGALTTFSAMQLELLRMLDNECYGLAVGYGLGSVAVGLAAVALAAAVARRVGTLR